MTYRNKMMVSITAETTADRIITEIVRARLQKELDDRTGNSVGLEGNKHPPEEDEEKAG